jgi:hypothetical protein
LVNADPAVQFRLFNRLNFTPRMLISAGKTDWDEPSNLGESCNRHQGAVVAANGPEHNEHGPVFGPRSPLPMALSWGYHPRKKLVGSVKNPLIGERNRMYKIGWEGNHETFKL